MSRDDSFHIVTVNADGSMTPPEHYRCTKLKRIDGCPVDRAYDEADTSIARRNPGRYYIKVHSQLVDPGDRDTPPDWQPVAELGNRIGDAR